MEITKEIPANAVAVKVTNFLNPSSMRIYHEHDFHERLNEISAKLQLVMKNRRRRNSRPKLEPRIGDAVIMHNRPMAEEELPAWWMRGILKHMDPEMTEYNILLVDHGHVIKACREDFTIVRRSMLPFKHVTFTVGIYNLLPLSHEKDKISGEVITGIGKQWSALSVYLATELIKVAQKLYFDYVAVDEYEKPYGELYLLIDNKILSLSQVLVYHEQAMYLREDIISLIKEKNEEKSRQDLVNDRLIVATETKILDPPLKHKMPSTYKQNGKVLFKKAASELEKEMRNVNEDCQQILVRSNDHCERLTVIEDALFPQRIHAVLRNFEMIALRKMQSYMWPAVSKGLSVIAVGPPKCGKTIGYVVPIVSAIASRKMIPKGNKPPFLILCSSTSNVLSTSALCNDLLMDYTDIRCVAGWNGRPEKSLVADIYNGCQILVTTPPFLERFINRDEAHRKLIDFSSLQYLVMDELDIVLSRYYEPFKLLLRKFIKIGSKERPKLDQNMVQTVAVSRHWTSLVELFTNECMTNPYICIGSYMEAAIFGRVMPQLFFLPIEKKMEKISELLTDEVLMIKTMIICGNSKEAHALNDYISKTRKTLLVCEKMSFMDVHGVKEIWKACVSGVYPILICTDEVLVTLNITDIDWLVHFTIELPSKSQFYFRFSTIMDNLKEGKKQCKVTIAIDETNTVQLYGVIMAAKHCGTKIPKKMMDNVMQIVANLDYEKKMYPVCDNVKAFGFCPKKYSCPYRHCVLAEIDKPSLPIAQGFKVKLNVTYVHDATHFTARVMEFINLDKKVTSLSACDYVNISSDIQAYYADKKNWRCHVKVQVGDICVIEESLDNFQRVKVLNITTINYEGIPITVDVKCIDSGQILRCVSVTRLMEIPKQLANRSTHIVEVFLAGLVPYDDEYEWNSRAIDDTHSWFPDKNMPNSFVLGTVKLHLGDTIWVDPLEIHTPIIGNPILINSSLKPHILKLKHGKSHDDHLPKLYELCCIGGLTNLQENSEDFNGKSDSESLK